MKVIFLLKIRKLHYILETEEYIFLQIYTNFIQYYRDRLQDKCRQIMTHIEVQEEKI